MRVTMTAFGGKKGTLSKGCGTLTLKADCELEAKDLSVIIRALTAGGYGFWSRFMGAVCTKKISKKEIAMLNRIAKRMP